MITHMASSVEDRLLHVSIVVLLCGLVFMYYTVFANKPLYGVLTPKVSPQDINKSYFRINVPLVKSGAFSDEDGRAIILEINNFTVLQLSLKRLHDPVHIYDLSVYKGSCSRVGRAAYVFPPMIGHKGWLTLYDITWEKLKQEMPLALVVQSKQVQDDVFCADLSL